MMRYLLLLAVAVAAHGQFGAATSVVSGNGAPVAAQCTNANNVGRVWARKDGGAASTTFYICAATGAGTYGWQLNDGAIGGAGNIASGQVLYGTAAGVAGSNANFVWDAVNNRLRIGGAVVGFAEFRNASNVATSFYGTASGFMATGGPSDLGFRATNAILFATNGDNERARFAATTGNLLLGTTTDGNFRLDVASSGSSGTLRAYDQTPTTGATSVIVRAGAGQSTTNLQTWQDSGGTALAGITGAGSFFTGNNANATGDSLIDANGLRFGSTVLVRWSNNLPFNAPDLSLSRATTNTLQVGDGGSNANGIVSAASYRAPLTTPASATATGTTGTIVWDANYIYIATGTNTWKRVAIATW